VPPLGRRQGFPKEFQAVCAIRFRIRTKL
jgi:hypothetical protein